jgi:hypothetical protein
VVGRVLRSRCRGYQQGRCCCLMTRHTLIVEGPEGSMTTMELFPGRRLAAVNHEDEDEGEE